MAPGWEPLHPVPPTPAPEVIDGRYELGALLGRGGMGEVREGLDNRLGRAVAVKLLRADLAAEPELRRRFEVEARAAAGLSHPNVVAVYDTGEHDGVPYLVMELLGGRTLADEIAAGPLEPERVEQLARQVLAALDAAHRAGVVHRDVKPGNLLLAGDSSVKVGDFGIAKAAEGLGPDVTVTGQVLGTPAYLAPERLQGQTATARSDLFSLGVVLYEALTGVKPFDGATPWGVAQAVVNGQHRPLDEVAPGVPPRLVETVERAMRKDPEERFASATAMTASLDGAEAATVRAPTATGPAPREATERLVGPPIAPGEPGRPALWWPGRRAAAVAAAILVLLLVAVALAGRDGGPSDVGPTTSTSTAPGRGLPEPLDRAIDRLDESVRP